MDDRSTGAEKSPRMKVQEWDEERDPSRVPANRPSMSWHRLGANSRLFLDSLADGSWVREGALRAHLRWGRLKFFLVSSWLVARGWVEARPSNSYARTQYRLSERVWS